MTITLDDLELLIFQTFFGHGLCFFFPRLVLKTIVFEYGDHPNIEILNGFCGLRLYAVLQKTFPINLNQFGFVLSGFGWLHIPPRGFWKLSMLFYSFFTCGYGQIPNKMFCNLAFDYIDFCVENSDHGHRRERAKGRLLLLSEFVNAPMLARTVYGSRNYGTVQILFWLTLKIRWGPTIMFKIILLRWCIVINEWRLHRRPLNSLNDWKMYLQIFKRRQSGRVFASFRYGISVH